MTASDTPEPDLSLLPDDLCQALTFLVLLDYPRTLDEVFTLMETVNRLSGRAEPLSRMRVKGLLQRFPLESLFPKSSEILQNPATITGLLLRFFRTAPPGVAAELKNRIDPPKKHAAVSTFHFTYSSRPILDFPLQARLLFSLFGKDEVAFSRIHHELKSYHYGSQGLDHFLNQLIAAPIPSDWIGSAPPKIRKILLLHSVETLLGSLNPVYDPPGRIALIRSLESAAPSYSELRHDLLHVDLLSGDKTRLSEALSATPPLPLPTLQGISAWERFMAGDPKEGVALFKKMATTIRTTESRKRLPLPEPFAFFEGSALLLLSKGNPSIQKTFFQRYALTQKHNSFHEEAHQIFALLVYLHQGLDQVARPQFEQLLKLPESSFSPLSRAMLAAGALHLSPRHLEDRASEFLSLACDYRTVTPLVSALVAGALSRNPSTADEGRKLLEDPALSTLLEPFSPLLDRGDIWEQTFAGIEAILGVERSVEDDREGKRRLAWLFDLEDSRIEPFEETFRKGQWKRSRRVALRRLIQEGEKFPLSPQDRAILESLTLGREYALWGQWSINPIRTPLALCGHPAIYDIDNPDRRIELEADLPELLIEELPEGFRLSLTHYSSEPKVFIEPLSATRYRVVEISPSLVDLGLRISPLKGLVVPRSFRDRLVSLLGKTVPFVRIRAEIASADIPAEEGDPRPVLQLAPLGEGLTVSAGVRPFGPDGPFFPTGRGGRLVTFHTEGSVRHARRDMERETALLGELLSSHLPILSTAGDGSGIWILDDLGSALELLESLSACPLPVTVEWPQGERFRVTAPVSSKNLRLSVRTARDWFEVSGSVSIDETLTMEMSEILEALPKAQGRFVPLSGGRFLSLTQELKSRLERFSTVAEEGNRLSVPGTLAMDDLFEEAKEIRGDAKWKEFRRRLREAADFVPRLPSTFVGELRDYQQEGFDWMSRLAHWGAGACLADDMGLGKTVQAIGVMCDLAPRGPILIVAPTSVCHNWENELVRFAPTLRVRELRIARDRQEMIEGLAAGDVLITSYGLLAALEESLAGKRWAMAVFDEAQAFKNAESKRAGAARKIDADFRLALTGTPVENDLDELWSLFSVLNPRLLGSRERFSARFASPIQRSRDSRVLASLRSLIRPFMLRRTKVDVLSELPPRTEITLDVELPSEERALYEALRRKALHNIEGIKREGGSQRIHILAEITRLRRALCHPALVDPLTLLSGAKLEAFFRLVEELLQNRHKALVFSQFTGLLERVAQSLDQRGIAYQYLDGSTPPRERERRVEAFQSGQGDLFLISLRAGGTGLNLTAADYVIHLDPWWNPAVEDQASDRAHRIGQQRPVTIYRLIVRESIEEKILDLHKKKRDLATDLLEGGEISGKLTNDELIALIVN